VKSLLTISLILCVTQCFGQVSAEFGQAPADTVATAESFKRLASIFENCDFSATQTTKSVSPNGGRNTEINRVLCKACQDAVVIFDETLHKDQVSSTTGRRFADRISHYERRWLQNEPRFTTSIVVGEGEKWPTTSSWGKSIDLDNIHQPPVNERDREYTWRPLLVAAMVGQGYTAGASFAELVEGREPWGYKVEKILWASSARTKVIYYFSSPDYGALEVTFSKLGDWKPTLVRLIKLANHIAFPESLLGAKNRIKNFQAFVEFSQRTEGLDQLEWSYEIIYSSGGSDLVLPEQINRTTVLSWNGEQAVTKTALVFNSFESGSVSCDDVLASMLPIPNGTDGYMVRSPGLDKLAWETKDGKLVKAYSLDGARMGREATFSSSRKLSLIATSVAVVALSVLVLYRRYYQDKVGL